jgi:surface polysaccharide O-acyltransferase-like enzyme
MMTTDPSSRNRILWADLCRITATLGVILIHVSAPVFYDRQAPLDSFLAANLFDSLSRVSVPLFVMLSGSLLLKGSPSLRSVLRRVIKVTLPLLFWSLVYSCWNNRAAWRTTEGFIGAVGSMLSGPVISHLWFVYMIVGLYILLPILSVVAVALERNRTTAVYLFTLWLAVNVLPVYVRIPLFKHLILSGFFNWAGFFLLGGWLDSAFSSGVFRPPSRGTLLFIYLLASTVTFFLAWHVNPPGSVPDETPYSYFSPNVVAASVAAFLCLRQTAPPPVLAGPLRYLSERMYAVYLMHLLTIELLTYAMKIHPILPRPVPPLLGIPALAVATALVSLGVASVLRLVPKSETLTG